MTLPRPDADARQASDVLVARIRDEIGARGDRIGFDRFMEMALYTPGLGYYAGGAHKFGPAGDFVTAPELTPLFLANTRRAGTADTDAQRTAHHRSRCRFRASGRRSAART